MNKYKKRVAFYYTFLFHRRIYNYLAKFFQFSLFSNDLDEIEEWHPDVIVIAEAPQIPMVRSYCDLHNYYLIGLRHGVAYKYITPEKEYSLVDYMCGSEWDKEEFSKSNIQPRRQFFLTGNPWVDEVFKIKHRTLNTSSPTILFAPTWNPETSAAGFFKDKLVELIRTVYPHSKIIIKPHPATIEQNPMYMDSYINIFKQWVSNWGKMASIYKNVEFIKDPAVSIAKFYSISDILISDGSSLIYEFMVLNRPILLYRSGVRIPDPNYTDQAIGNLWRDVGDEFTNTETFISCLKMAFQKHSQKFSKTNKAYIRKLYGKFCDGESIKRVANVIDSLPLTKFVLFNANSSNYKATMKNRIERQISNCIVEFSGNSKTKNTDKNEQPKTEYIVRVNSQSAEKIQHGNFLANGLTTLIKNDNLIAIGFKKKIKISDFLSTYKNCKNTPNDILLKHIENSDHVFMTHLDCDGPILSKKAYTGLTCCSKFTPLALEKAIRSSGGKTTFFPDQEHNIQIVFKKGAYAAEGEKRWLSQIAKAEIYIPPISNFRTFEISFDLFCPNIEYYSSKKLVTTIYINQKLAHEVEFIKSGEKQTIKLLIDEMIEKPVKISFFSSDAFVPAKIGTGPDTRRLSVVFANFAIKIFDPSSKGFCDLIDDNSALSILQGSQHQLKKQTITEGKTQKKVLVISPPLTLKLETPSSNKGKLSFFVSVEKDENHSCNSAVFGIMIDDSVVLQSVVCSTEWEHFIIPVPFIKGDSHNIIVETAVNTDAQNCRVKFKDVIFSWPF